MKFHIGDYLADTMHLTTLQHGIYIRLIMHAFKRGSLPAARAQLMRIAGVAGALYVPQVGIINPSRLEPAESIEIAIWVAVGGRGTLSGAILGALVVNALKSYLTTRYPGSWLYVLGALFVAVVMLLPDGLISLPERLRAIWTRFARRAPRPAGALEVVREKEQSA